MLKRIKHFIFGHKYILVSSCHCHGDGRSPAFCDEWNFQKAWGFTQIVCICSCGHSVTWRVTGNHAPEKHDSEIEDLRKMAGLQ